MDVIIQKVSGIQTVALHGDLDGSTTPEAQAQILPLAEPGARILLDMSGVSFMSSAGLRMLLLMYRTISGRSGKVALVGLSEELADTMSLTGFLDFFTCYPTVDEGLKALS